MTTIYSKAGTDAAIDAATDALGLGTAAQSDAADFAPASSGAYPVQQVTLTDNLAYTLPVDAPADQVISVVFTQDGTGGHTVTYDGQPVTVDTAAGASTLVEVWPGGTLVYPGASAPAGASSAITADDTPAAPAEGESASYFVTATVSWPAGLVWSTDPDGGVAPTITGTALVSMFTVGGITRAVLGATFPAIPDNDAPTTPTGLTATATGANTANLSWSASTDNVLVTGYEYRIGAGAAVDAGAGTTETVSGLNGSTLYSFEVRAYDAAGNRSGWSAAATATTTPSIVDTFTRADGSLVGTRTESGTKTWLVDNLNYVGAEYKAAGLDSILIAGGKLDLPVAAGVNRSATLEVGQPAMRLAVDISATAGVWRLSVASAGYAGTTWGNGVMATWSAASGVARLYSAVNAAWVQIGTDYVVATSPSKRVVLQYDGATASLSVNGAVVRSGAIVGLTGTRCGIASATTAVGVVDNIEVELL